MNVNCEILNYTMQNKVSIKVGGPAGEGVFTIGLLLSKFLKKSGLYVVYTTDYPSLIKGGHNTCCVRAEDEYVSAELKFHDVVVCLDALALQEDVPFKNDKGCIITDLKLVNEEDRYIGIPFEELYGDAGKRYKNTIAFGALVSILCDECEVLTQVLSMHFAKKPQEVIDLNVEMALKGFNYVKEKYESRRLHRVVSNREGNDKKDNEKSDEQLVMISGNDAAALGALKAGVKFVSEYPMTPSSSFLSFFASHELDYNITTKHAEDEIAAINNVIGASAAGARAMTATSGGGFALMNEAISFAGISENPLVIFECMRAGPSTGLPTYTDQGDLMHVLYSGSGEFPKVVLAPGDIEECFYESFEAFNIADITQTPVIVLLDKHLASTQLTSPRFDTSQLKINRGNFQEFDSSVELKNYKRYELTQTGLSKRVVIGQKGAQHVNSSYEHDETGWTSEDGNMHKLQMEKRFNKLQEIPLSRIRPKVLGDIEEYEITLISWGSTKTILQEAMKYLQRNGIKVRLLHFIYLHPCDWGYVEELLREDIDTHSKKRVLLFECNMTGQLKQLIKMNTGLDIEVITRYDARPFYFEEVYEEIEKRLKKD